MLMRFRSLCHRVRLEGEGRSGRGGGTEGEGASDEDVDDGDEDVDDGDGDGDGGDDDDGDEDVENDENGGKGNDERDGNLRKDGNEGANIDRQQEEVECGANSQTELNDDRNGAWFIAPVPSYMSVLTHVPLTLSRTCE